MARLIVDGDHVEVELSPVEKTGALRRTVRFPLASVTTVTRVEVAREAVRGIRAPGTHWPGGVALGTWRKKGSKSFVAVSGRGAGYVIDLEDQNFDRLIVESEPIRHTRPPGGVSSIATGERLPFWRSSAGVPGSSGA